MIRFISRGTPLSVRLLLSMILCAGVVGTASIASAQSLTEEKPPKERGQGPTRAELKKRFEARFSDLNELKDKGFVGESFDGYVEALDDRLLSKTQRQMLEDENVDRKALYGLIADRVDEGEQRVPPRVVAERNARRNFEKADPGHYLKTSEYRWIQKRDESRATRIERLKADGVVGETFDGFIASVRGKADDDVEQVIAQENRDRRALYDQVAGSIEKADAAQVARQMAREMYEHLPAGHFYKSKEGAWERKPDRQR